MARFDGRVAGSSSVAGVPRGEPVILNDTSKPVDGCSGRVQLAAGCATTGADAIQASFDAG